MEKFFTKSQQIQHIIKSFNLTKTLFVSSIIIGDANIGKKTLIHSLFPTIHWVSGEDQKKVEEALEVYNELIIYNFEKLSNYSNFDFTNKRIIAIANYMGNSETIDKLFAFIYMMPPLKERTEDVDFLINHFLKEAKNTLMIKEKKINKESLPINLTHNSKSLKKNIYYYLFTKTVKSADIQKILYDYFIQNLEGNNSYRDHLHIYEKPLIQAGLDKYNSQLKLSEILGINRNTLRKKIHEHNID